MQRAGLPQRTDAGDLPQDSVINGKFRILSFVAKGGMGAIYRAEQAPLGRTVALKVLRTPQTGDGGDPFQKRFLREASILARLSHPNIVTLHDYGSIDGDAHGRYFMAMELLKGETLADRLRASGSVSPGEALRILRPIARGLREAHKLGAIHRDLKPSNVMIVPDEDGGEIVKILDFGIGKLIGDSQEQELTQEGAFLGSPKYVAPEQINERRVDARTDVYALGVIAYELACGRVPFEGETNLETVLAHCNKELPRMSERGAHAQVPEPYESFVRRLLEKDPAKRPQSMDEVLRAIADCERALFGVSSQASMPSDPNQRGTPSGGPEADTLTSNTGIVGGRPSIGTQATVTKSSRPPALGAWGARRVVAVSAAAIGLVAAVEIALRVSAGAPAGAQTAVPAAAAPAPPPAARSFSLVVDSTPQGAKVYERGDMIGATPMQIAIERASVKDAPRTFVLRLDGYAPYTVLQGDSESSVVTIAPLAALAPAAASASASVSAAAAAPRFPARAAAVPPPSSRPAPGLDIKLER